MFFLLLILRYAIKRAHHLVVDFSSQTDTNVGPLHLIRSRAPLWPQLLFLLASLAALLAWQFSAFALATQVGALSLVVLLDLVSLSALKRILLLLVRHRQRAAKGVSMGSRLDIDCGKFFLCLCRPPL